MNERNLREAVAQALSSQGQQVMAQATKHLHALLRLHESGQIVWRALPSPKGSRSFQGSSGNYMVMVTQFNTGVSIEHRGMATYTGESVCIIVVTVEDAEKLYRSVAAQFN